MPRRSKSYEVSLSERLKDQDYALAYLEAAWEDEDGDVFLLALNDVASARGFSAVASAAGVNRESLYRGLSKNGNPTFTTLRSVLRALGVPFGPRASKAHSEVVAPLALTVVETYAYQALEPAETTPWGETPAWMAQRFAADMEASLYVGGM